MVSHTHHRKSCCAWLVAAVIGVSVSMVNAQDLGLAFGKSESQTNVYNGRYSYMPSEKLLLDNETGKMWVLCEVRVDGDCNTYKLIPIQYLDTKGNKTGVYPEPQQAPNK